MPTFVPIVVAHGGNSGSSKPTTQADIQAFIIFLIIVLFWVAGLWKVMDWFGSSYREGWGVFLYILGTLLSLLYLTTL